MKYKRCIIILADGSRPDVFKELLNEGRLPNIANHILQNGSFHKAVSVFPSTTGPAHIPFLTGCLPATCNIPGIRWFDKKMYDCYGHGNIFSLGSHGRYRSYVGIETFRINQDLRNDIYTVFEIIPKSYSIFNSINRGAGRRNLTKIMRIWYWYYGHLTDRWKFVDKAAFDKMSRVVETDFEFVFSVMPAIDEYAHLAHPRHESAVQQYCLFDESIGHLVEKLKRLKKWDDSIFLIVSDHGLTQTHAHFCFNTFLESRGIKTFYFPLVYRKDCVAANMVSGNGMTHLYFKKRDGWADPLTIEDIEEMYPGLVADMLKEEAVDIVAVRGRDGNINAMRKNGTAKINLDGNNITYAGANPFGYNFHNTVMSSRDLLDKTIESDYPDAPYQLAHIFGSPRCGDVVVSATKGYDLRIKYEDPEHKSSHGSLHSEHMMVPVISNIRLPDKNFRTVDIFPTYLKLLGHKIPDGIDGRAVI